jgi:diketogulonate reductase-like aldo/keto reductase
MIPDAVSPIYFFLYCRIYLKNECLANKTPRFPYQNLNYFDAMDHLVKLKAARKIKNIGLTNFDTTHMEGLMSRGAPIVSNQVSGTSL